MSIPPVVEMMGSPTIYREHVVVRGPSGPATFRSIERPFQRPVLKAIDTAFLALQAEKMPPITRIWFEATKGCGKDTITAMMILWLMAFTPRDLDIKIGASDKEQADDLKRAGAQILRQNEWLRRYVESQNFVLVNQSSGSRAEIIPADEMGSHGARPDVCIINEVTHHADRGFYDTMMDNATKVSTNVTIVLTNHGHLDTWQWEMRENARTSKLWSFHSYTKPAPWIPKAQLDERRRTSHQTRYARLFEGQWVRENESALSSAAIDASVTLKGPLRERIPDDRIFAGLDIGVSRDRTALVAVSRRPGERLGLALCQSWVPEPMPGMIKPQVNLKDVKDAVRAAHQKYAFYVINYDPTQCESIAQELRGEGLPMEPVPFQSAKNLTEMATALIESFNSDDIALYKDRQLIEDLKKLRFIEKGDTYRLDADRDRSGHADSATAFLLALLGAFRHPFAWIHPFFKGQLIYTLDELPTKLQATQGDKECQSQLQEVPDSRSSSHPIMETIMRDALTDPFRLEEDAA